MLPKLIARAHQQGIRVIGSTKPPFENAFLAEPRVTFYTPEKEMVRQKVNAWILNGGEFDAVVDLDAVLRDPSHPTRLLPSYDSVTICIPTMQVTTPRGTPALRTSWSKSF